MPFCLKNTTNNRNMTVLLHKNNIYSLDFSQIAALDGGFAQAQCCLAWQ